MGLLDKVKELFSGAAGDALSGVKDTVADAGKSAIDSAVEAVSSVSETAGDIAGSVADAGKDAIDSAVDGDSEGGEEETSEDA